MSSPASPKRHYHGKREVVICAALDEFQQQGFQETSMDRIAEAAQVSKRTVYNHFPSKESLFEAIREELVNRCGHLQLDAPNDEPLEEQLLVVGRKYAELMTSDDFIKLSRVVLSRFIQSPLQVGQAITGREPQLPIEEWMRAAQREGLLPQFDVEQATTEFAGMITSTEFWPKLIQGECVPNDKARDAYLRSIVAMFLGHYGHPKARGRRR
ncbi:TetR/AcrR family transcriptional regulator [Parahaliea mediterranea]|uniref:TetR/AcrR family transcriptional regulator n=1 Tax=Parahaliea mediterranea TaxID=651086 RepID=UPI000E2F77E6|nr:TetR/AcrR family transcriptional regulator [Parahaliea mediterranea]